jgi:hypothetical protein
VKLEPEEAWLRQRVIRLRSTLRYVKVAQVEIVLREIITDMEARLELLEAEMRRRPLDELAINKAQGNDSADYLPKSKPAKEWWSSQHKPAIWVQANDMEHRGVRYALRIGIAPGQWCVAIYPGGDSMPKERLVSGTREEAEATARSMINALLKKAIRVEKACL